MKWVVRDGDQARGHTDILWNEIIGVIQSVSKVRKAWIWCSKEGDTVSFPSHPHALDGYWNPTSYRSHSIWVQSTSRHLNSGAKFVLDWDTIPVADEAGGNASMQATQFTYVSN